MIDIFQQTREMVSALDVSRYYRMEFDRRGERALCIFHPDHHPSMTFKNGNFRCWACGAHGSSIDLVAQLFGLSALDAVKKINTDFHLGLDLERRDPTPQEREQFQQRKQISETYQAFQTWRSNMIRQLNAAYRTAHLALMSDATLDKLTDAEVLAIKWQPAIEYLSDCLMFGDMEQQMTVFRQRKEVENLCQKILICSQKSSQTKPDVA